MLNCVTSVTTADVGQDRPSVNLQFNIGRWLVNGSKLRNMISGIGYFGC